MTQITESGAIVDPNELAAILETSPEAIQAEDEQIVTTSLEELLDSITAVIELPEDEIPVTSLEPAMESLINVLHDIRDAGGISRSDAQALQQMTASMEGFQDIYAKAPINSFTELPSKVNYDASMEGFLGGIGRKIIEIIKAIVQWIKDRAKAFIALFRNNRIKAKQTEVAAEKVVEGLQASINAQSSVNWAEVGANYAEAGKNIQDTLDAMKANQAEWDKLRQKLGDKNMNGWAKGAEQRSKDRRVQIELPSLAVFLAGEGHDQRFTKSYVAMLDLSASVWKDFQEAGNDQVTKVAEHIIKLDKALFEKSELNFTGGTASECTAALGRIAARLNSEAQDVDVYTTEKPEAMVTSMINLLNASYKTRGSSVIIINLETAMSSSNQQIQHLNKMVENRLARGEVIESNHPLMVNANNYKLTVRSCEHIDSIYRSIMNAYAKTIKVGADLAKDPSKAKAA